MYTTRAALRTIIPNRSGVIVNVSSLNGTRGFPDRASYGATKAAVINFTQTTAMENRLHGIRANCLVPGAIDGQRLRTLQGGMAAQPGQALVIGEAPRSRVQSLFGGSLTSF